MTYFDEIVAAARVAASQLQGRLDESFDNETAADLALLQIGVFEQDAEPLKLSNAVLDNTPSHGPANLVRAYLSLHYLMSDDELRRSSSKLEALIATGVEVAAASLLLGEIRRSLDPEEPFTATADLMLTSIAAAPTWALGHLQLARAMREERQFDQAREEYDRAIARLIDDTGMPPLQWSYAICFTGQLSDRSHLERERDELPTPN